MPKVLVYGWYHQGNIGDDFFIESFNHLFPNLDLIFTDHISAEQLQDIDAVFIGGGSFLGTAPHIDKPALDLLRHKKIFYLGVGVESDIHSTHIELMSLSKLIITRSVGQLDHIKSINENVLFAPDIAYALQAKVKSAIRKNKTILVFPNTNVVPHINDPHWKHAAWNYFKSEFCQFLDWLIDNGYQLKFFPLCQAKEIHDGWAAAEMISHMKYHNHQYISTSSATNMADVSKMVSKFSGVITQRFHGIILSEMTKTPYLSIYHHDKLKDCSPAHGQFLSYYNSSKQNLIDAFNSAIEMNFDSILPIETNTFEAFSNQVITLL